MQRGRKSKASLSVVPVIPRVERPEPPPEYGPDEARIWRAVVEAAPPGWLNAAVETLLRLYVGHAVTAEHLGEALRGTALTDPALFDRLLKLRQRETSAALRVARAMSLVVSSRRKPAPRPWEIRPA
jgi:hypothetical protein